MSLELCFDLLSLGRKRVDFWNNQQIMKVNSNALAIAFNVSKDVDLPDSGLCTVRVVVEATAASSS